MTNAREQLERILKKHILHYAEENVLLTPSVCRLVLAKAILTKLPELGFVRLGDVEMEKEIAEMQEVADDKEASPEIRSNANSYIRGMKKAKAIAEAKGIIRVKEGK